MADDNGNGDAENRDQPHGGTGRRRLNALRFNIGHGTHHQVRTIFARCEIFWFAEQNPDCLRRPGRQGDLARRIAEKLVRERLPFVRLRDFDHTAVLSHPHVDH